MHRFSSPSPTSPDPPMTYDEASMQGSRHFFMALQELKHLRPQLYSAAEYCESSYLFNDQKQVVLDNLKDYTIKALVNAVDHLGTVAYKLNEVLSEQTNEISSAEIRVAGLAQRIRTCQEHTYIEGLDRQRQNKVNRRYHKHYVLPDAMPDRKDDQRQDNRREKRTESPQELESETPHPVADTGRTLSWHLAADPFTATKGAPIIPQGKSRLAQSGMASEDSISDHDVPVHSTERMGGFPSRTTILSPALKGQPRGHGQTSSFDSSKPLSSHLSFNEKHIDVQRPPLTSRSKSLLSSLLGRRRSGKARGHT